MSAASDFIFAKIDALCVEKYLARGRCHVDMPTDQLRGAWAAAFRDLAREPNAETSLIEQNLRGELLVRGLSTPDELVATELEQLNAYLDAIGPSAIDPDGAGARELVDYIGRRPQ